MILRSIIYSRNQRNKREKIKIVANEKKRRKRGSSMTGQRPCGYQKIKRISHIVEQMIANHPEQ